MSRPRRPTWWIPAAILVVVPAAVLGSCGAEPEPEADPEPYSQSRDCVVAMAAEAREEARDEPAADDGRIRPYRGNPCYWEYRGEPVLLLGATDQDNLFNHPDIWPFGLESHLDLMVAAGGNYVRNTMASRDPGNRWAHFRGPNGLYDLERWDEEYWGGLERLLELALERDIIVQIEVWDRFDFAREPWQDNPFNPRNNRNYEEEDSGLPTVVEGHPQLRENPFFRSIPELDDLPLVLGHQQAFVDRLLSITLAFPNVLYVISNETNESQAWSAYWAHWIRDAAAELGVEVHVTEMWDPWNLGNPMHLATFDHPELYTFADISQNNHQPGQTHWDNAQRAMVEHLTDPPRPVNSVKIYGGERHGHSLEEGTRRLWRNILGGMASARFHRTGDPLDAFGAGLRPLARAHVAAARAFTDSVPLFQMRPRLDLLSDRDPDEAYAMAAEGEAYALYFPNGGRVALDLSAAPAQMEGRWLSILAGQWGPLEAFEGGGVIPVEAPASGHWALFLRPVED